MIAGVYNRPNGYNIYYWIETRLNIPFLHFIEGMINRSCGKCHIRERRIDASAGGHAGPIGDKKVFHGMQLVPFVQDGCFFIVPHPGGAHFMVGVAGKGHGSGLFHIFQANPFEHGLHGFGGILENSFFVFLEGTIDGHPWPAVNILDVVVEGDAVFCVRKGFAMITQVDLPLSGFGCDGFKVFTDGITAAAPFP